MIYNMLLRAVVDDGMKRYRTGRHTCFSGNQGNKPYLLVSIKFMYSSYTVRYLFRRSFSIHFDYVNTHEPELLNISRSKSYFRIEYYCRSKCVADIQTQFLRLLVASPWLFLLTNITHALNEISIPPFLTHISYNFPDDQLRVEFYRRIFME